MERSRTNGMMLRFDVEKEPGSLCTSCCALDDILKQLHGAHNVLVLIKQQRQEKRQLQIVADSFMLDRV